MLQAQLHGCERVLDLVGHLAGHLAPGAFPFAGGQAIGAGAQFGHLAVVHLHKVPQLVLPLVADRFVGAPQRDPFQALLQQPQRTRGPVGDEGGCHHREHEEHGEQVHDGHDEPGALLFQFGLTGEVGQGQVGQHIALIVPQGRVTGAEGRGPDPFLLHIGTGPLQMETSKGSGVHPTTQQARGVHLFPGGGQQLAIGGKEREVGEEDIAQLHQQVVQIGPQVGGQPGFATHFLLQFHQHGAGAFLEQFP